MNRPRNWKYLLFLIVMLSLSTFPVGLHAASALTQTQISGADGAIQAAFISTQNAERMGGNVSALVAELNSAIQMVQNAEAENSTNPALASSDLSNATQIAQRVSADAGPAGQQGAAARDLQFYVSAGSAAAIVAIAAVIYAFGDRLYHVLWLRMHGDQVVKKTG